MGIWDLGFYLLFDRAAWGKGALEVGSRRWVISGDFLTIFSPLISILYKLQNTRKQTELVLVLIDQKS